MAGYAAVLVGSVNATFSLTICMFAVSSRSDVLKTVQRFCCAVLAIVTQLTKIKPLEKSMVVVSGIMCGALLLKNAMGYYLKQGVEYHTWAIST